MSKVTHEIKYLAGYLLGTGNDYWVYHNHIWQCYNVLNNNFNLSSIHGIICFCWLQFIYPNRPKSGICGKTDCFIWTVSKFTKHPCLIVNDREWHFYSTKCATLTLHTVCLFCFVFVVVVLFFLTSWIKENHLENPVPCRATLFSDRFTIIESDQINFQLKM